MNERIKKVRKYLKLSQESFGEKIGVTKSAISKAETLDKSVSNQFVVSICREFNVREEWLREGKGEMFNQLSPSEQAAFDIGKLMNTNDPFILNAFSALAEMSEEELLAIKKFVDTLANGKKNTDG